MRIILAACLFFSSAAFSAESIGGLTRQQLANKGLRRQVTIILLGGLAGGAVGLSTLSFYGRPQDKLTHIPVGIALGLVAGTVYSTYQLVNNPREMMGDIFEPDGRDEMARREQASSIVFHWKTDF